MHWHIFNKLSRFTIPLITSSYPSHSIKHAFGQLVPGCINDCSSICVAHVHAQLAGGNMKEQCVFSCLLTEIDKQTLVGSISIIDMIQRVEVHRLSSSWKWT